MTSRLQAIHDALVNKARTPYAWGDLAAIAEEAVINWEREHGVFNGLAMEDIRAGQPVQLAIRDGLGEVRSQSVDRVAS